jgi:hypothetical protein
VRYRRGLNRNLTLMFKWSFRNSVIVNATAYRHIALDMPLFSLFSADIQLAYFEHFSVLLRTSRFRRFNSKSRFSKFGAVRKFIFALQLDAFKDGVVTALVDALHVTAEMNWSTDAAIKPLVSYLAAALHEGISFEITVHCFPVISV